MVLRRYNHFDREHIGVPVQPTDTHRFLFRSKKFSIRIGEDVDTNPFMYGKDLAEWLQRELRGYYDSVEEVIPEDWGWCVMCKRDPIDLFVIVVNVLDQATIDSVAKQKMPEEVVWYVEPVADIAFWKRSQTRDEGQQLVAELHAKLSAILNREPAVEFLTEQEIEEWDDTTPHELTVPAELMLAPERMSRWITLPVGLILLPVLILCVFGGVALLIDPPNDTATARMIIGSIMLAASGGLGVLVLRLILGHESPYGGLFSPYALRFLAVFFGAASIGLLFTSVYSREPFRGLTAAALWVTMAIAMWKIVARRIDRAKELDKNS